MDSYKHDANDIRNTGDWSSLGELDPLEEICSGWREKHPDRIASPRMLKELDQAIDRKLKTWAERSRKR